MSDKLLEVKNLSVDVSVVFVERETRLSEVQQIRFAGRSVICGSSRARQQTKKTTD